MYAKMHSPIRSQLFKVKLMNIPAFVAHHLRTHYAGVMNHFITSRRDDRGGEANETRSEPVDMLFDCNAETLISICRKRLCKASHAETVKVIRELKAQIEYVDPDLFNFLVPECLFRNGICPETNRSCGYISSIRGRNDLEKYQDLFSY